MEPLIGANAKEVTNNDNGKLETAPPTPNASMDNKGDKKLIRTMMSLKRKNQNWTND